ncbi:BTB/POZ domain-containing protein 2 [Aphelenchoides avenae]|nr:BTB/POZ domain-containing protein 2 [Aphelenchus avenae]
MTSSDKKVLRIPMKDHLRNASPPTDVTFVFHVFQGEGTEQRKHMHDIVFPAHRDRLLAASPYFESLLAGDWKHMDEVSIEDCQPGAFRILLRWIYGDKMVVWSIRPSTFIAVLLAADRFDIKDLVSPFRDLKSLKDHLILVAEQLLTVADTVFFIPKILDMLEHWQIGCGSELTQMCLHYLDKNAAALTKRPSFLRISHERLMEILARNSLGINEIDLYRAAIKWAQAHLKRGKKRPTHQAIREVLGKALFLIRFPTMHPQEFTNGPAKDDILTAEEKLAIYGRIHSAGPTFCAFSAEPRKGPRPIPLRDFTPTYCQKCGTRLNGDACTECGCAYRPCVECTVCRRQVFVDAEPFAKTTYHSCPQIGTGARNCWAVTYRCSCGAPNVTADFGRIRCKRCWREAWRCNNDFMPSVTKEMCKCYVCRDSFPDWYSDDELTSFEDYSDDEDEQIDEDDEDEEIDDDHEEGADEH